MNSKEALENLTYCINGMESKEKYYKIIKQDLERLEKLEKENKELRKAIKQWNINGGNLLRENAELKNELEKLKERYKHRAETSNDLCKAVNQYEKAIEIIANKIEFEDLGEMQSGNMYRGYFNDCFDEEEVKSIKEIIK